MKKKILALGLTASFLLSFVGCSAPTAGQGKAEVPAEQNLMLDVKADRTKQDIVPADDGAAALTDFSVRLFQQSLEEDKNTLLSPTSVLFALAMTANGAKGDTLAQMEEVFGVSVEELNPYLCTYREALEGMESSKLSLANAIWFKDEGSLTVEPDFLQTNADYYNAGAYKAPFDEKTCEEINGWVSEHTNGMVKEILDEIPQEAVLYLVNALAFEAEWEEIYKETQVRDGVFTLEDGTKQDVKLMYSEEGTYLEDAYAIGFMKYYKDREYAFAAMLPKEDVSVSDYVASLQGATVTELFQTAQQKDVRTAIPVFESTYDVEMSKLLMNMGMTDAFDLKKADFSRMAHSTEGNIAISRVLHKTHIAVDEAGTKAGAATVVEMKRESCPIEEEEPKVVYLDRPFVYMIVDCDRNVPIFIGTLINPAEK